MRDIDDYDIEDSFNPDYIRLDEHDDALNLLKTQIKDEIYILIKAMESANLEEVQDCITQMLDYVGG